jgi:hypothetical protein
MSKALHDIAELRGWAATADRVNMMVFDKKTRDSLRDASREWTEKADRLERSNIVLEEPSLPMPVPSLPAMSVVPVQPVDHVDPQAPPAAPMDQQIPGRG